MTELPDFLQPMRDVEHGAPFVGQAAEGGEELARLLGRQDRGGLVHDQEAGFLQQATHHLDALAHTHGEIRHQRGGFQRQAVFPRHPGDPLRQRVRIERAGHGQGDVLHDGQCIEQ